MHKSVSFGKNFLYEVDDSKENVAVLESIKERHARIADMFLARPAPEEVRQEFERYFLHMSKKKEKKVKVRAESGGIKNEKKASEKKEKGKDDKKKEKLTLDKKKNYEKSAETNEKKKSVVPSFVTTDTMEEKKTVLNRKDRRSLKGQVPIALYSHLRNRFVNEKKQSKDEKEANLIKHQEKKDKRKWRKTKVTPAAYYLDDAKNDGDIEACDVDNFF